MELLVQGGAMTNSRFPRVALFLLAALWPSILLAEVTLVLKQSFIEKYKNRATIEVDFIVDHSTACNVLSFNLKTEEGRRS